MINIGCFGCLLLLALMLPALVLSLFKKSAEMLGATVVWLWESFLNIFRTMKKEVRNPWTGVSNFDKEDQERAEKEDEIIDPNQRNEDGTKPKLYNDNDGEYIDFTEVK